MPSGTRIELRENLETKLAIYDRFKANLAPEGTLIFTNRPEIWRTDKGPFIIASEPLPQPKPHYGANERDFVGEVIDFFRVMIRHPEYCYVCLRLFLLPSNELHVHLSHNRTAQSEPIQTYMKVPIPYSTELPGTTMTIQVFIYSPEILGSLGPHDFEVGIDLRDRQRQIVREVGLRFMSEELKQNLKEKVEKFARLIPYDAGTAVLFQLASWYWPSDLKFVLINHPTPPLPSYGDDYFKENIISRYILEYVKDVAEELNCSPFYAVCSIKKTKKKPHRWNAHLMFSQYEESLKCETSEPHLSTEDPPAKSIVRMPMYSNELYTEWYSKIRQLFDPASSDDSDQESPMDTDDESFDTADNESSKTGDNESSDTGDDESSDTGDDESFETGSEKETEEGGAQVQTLEDWAKLLGKELTSNLMTKVKAFAKDANAKAGVPVIFADALNFWPPGQYKVIPDRPPPTQNSFIKADLTYRRNAPERDVLNFVKWVPTHLKVCPPFYAACSKFGMDLCLETHLMFSLNKEPVMLASSWGCSTTEDPPEVAQKKYPLISSIVREPSSSQQSSQPDPSQPGPSQPSGSRSSYLVNIREFKTNAKLSLDIKKNLDYKLKLFHTGAPYEKGTAVLFADKPDFWPKDLKYVVLDDPPVPCFFQEFQSFDLAPWVRLMLDYLKERASQDGCVPFYASFSLKGYKEQRKRKKEGIEFMFSQSKAAIPAPNHPDYMSTEDPPERDAAMDTGPEEYVSLGPVLSPMRTRVVTEPPWRRGKKRKGCLRSPLKSLTRRKKSRHTSQDRGERSRSSRRERR